MSVKRLENEAEEGKCALAIEGEFNIYFAQVIHGQISEELAEATELELDLSAVEEFDSSGVQILLALRERFAQPDHRFAITASSEPVRRLLNTYQLEEALVA